MIKVILLLFVVFDFNPKDFSIFFWVIDGNQDDFTDIEMEAHLDPRRCSMSFSIRSHHQRKDFFAIGPSSAPGSKAQAQESE